MNTDRGIAWVVFGLALLAAALPLAARGQNCTPSQASDWLAAVPMSASSAQIRPADCATVTQTPPDFSWPDMDPAAQYQVTVFYPDGRARTLPAPQNWINWDEVLPAGDYSWQVQATTPSGSQTSAARRFSVASGAVSFLVPDWATLFGRAAAKPHPRALPDPATAQAMIDQRQPGIAMLIATVNGALADPVPAEPTSGSVNDVAVLAQDECRRMLDAALAWLVTSNQAYLTDAGRRAQNLAAWDPHGITGYAAEDSTGSLIAAALALTYDWLYPWIGPGQASQLQAAILARATDMYNDIIGRRPRVAVFPYDAHASETLIYLAVISVLLAGDVPQAETGVRDTLPLALNWISPWGGEDGGYGNGSAYAYWDTGSRLVPWYILRWVVGVDVAQKAWVRNWAQFISYFNPPGSPAGLFGDGSELALNEAWARYAKAYALFAPSPLARWYAAQLSGEDPSALELLLAPPADSTAASYPAGTPDAALLPSIGWVAMHSSLQDPGRVSVYFKSSPYGSYNHSHADQDGFVVYAGGQPLAINSGFFDGYMTPHWWQWYKQTRAHNAITFDGGQGQVVFEQTGQLGAGRISGYLHNVDYDIAQGDATQSYGGALTLAQRSLIYLRPNLIVVYDKLASAIERQWEWNIHALAPATANSDTRISIAYNGQSLCVDLLAGPGMRFSQTNQFTVNPSGTWFPEWHGAFVTTQPSAAAEIIALLRVGCPVTAASAAYSDGAWTVRVGAKTVTIADSGISVQ